MAADAGGPGPTRDRIAGPARRGGAGRPAMTHGAEDLARAEGPEAITSAALPVPHAFLTRRGGVSRGLYASLNCGRGSGDDPEAVAANRALAAGVLGVAPEALATVHQVHSARAVVLREAGPPEEADALVTDRPGLALGILTADCAPVLLADVEAGVVGAAHAGWRGALGGVIEAAVEAMASLGARPGRIAAAVGPSIGPAAYEVGPELEARFVARDPDAARFFHAPAGRAHLDLPAYALHRLRRAGVGRAEWTGHCTHDDPERFFSYRRSRRAGEPDYGRLISVVRLSQDAAPATGRRGAVRGAGGGSGSPPATA